MGPEKAMFTPVQSCTTEMVCIEGGAERFGRGMRVTPFQNLSSKIYDHLPNHYILTTCLMTGVELVLNKYFSGNDLVGCRNSFLLHY